MAWYDTGTVAVTNGSTTVTGTGTNFITGAQVGEAFLAPDDKLYEIASITSATVLVLADSYLGSTQSGQDYKIVPTQSLVADLANDVTDLISDYADVKDKAGAGKFNDGSVTNPAITFEQDQNNGLYRIGSDNWGLVAGGSKQVDISTTDVELNYSGSKKLATTSTGVDVTGTVTADGLTVDGNSTLGVEGTGSQVTMQMPSLSSSYPTRLFFNGTYDSGTSDVNIKASGVPSGGPYSANLNFFTSSQTALRKRMSIAGNGNVSFYEDTGTTAKMVWSSGNEQLNISGVLEVIDGSNGRINIGATNNYLYGDSTGNFIVGTSGSDKLLVNSAGNVGIGGTPNSWSTVTNVLQMKDKAAYSEHADTSYQSINWYYNAGEKYIGNAYAVRQALSGVNGSWSVSNAPLNASGAGAALAWSERARIDSSGNFRVGNTSTEISSVGGRMLADGRVIGVTNNSACFTARRFGSDGDLISLLNSNGAVVGGVGTYGSTTFIQSDSAANHVGLLFNGSQVEPCRNDGSSGGEPRADSSVDLGSSGYRFKDFYLSGNITSAGIYNNTSGGSANLGISSSGEMYRSTSSLVYKRDVNDATHGLTELMNLRPVTYKSIGEDETVYGGLIAEEVHGAGLTEFVEYNDDGEPDALAYANMVSLCIKAIQDQQETINELKARIQTLENK